MTEKQLRNLSRVDLLQLLIDQSEELQTVQEKLKAAEAKLEQREITMTTAGSIAEASLQLNGVFEAAQAACQQYADSLETLYHKQKTICDEIEEESLEKAGRLLIETEKRCEKMETETKIQCAEMVAKAKAEVQAYWDSIYQKLEAYYNQHIGLRELLSMIAPYQRKE